MTRIKNKKSLAAEEHFVYVLLLANGHYYCGYTGDVERRMQKHLSGRGSKCVRSFKPVMIKRVWRIYGSKGDALRAESFIKKLSRDGKVAILENPSFFGKQMRRSINVASRVREICKYADHAIVKISGGIR